MDTRKTYDISVNTKNNTAANFQSTVKKVADNLYQVSFFVYEWDAHLYFGAKPEPTLVPARTRKRAKKPQKRRSGYVGPITPQRLNNGVENIAADFEQHKRLRTMTQWMRVAGWNNFASDTFKKLDDLFTERFGYQIPVLEKSIVHSKQMRAVRARKRT